MIQRHTLYRGPVREWVPGSPAAPSGPRVKCDKGCGTVLRSSNPYGRCTPCCDVHGYPELAAVSGKARKPRERRDRVHVEGCECDERGYRSPTTGKTMFDITCPDCGKVRAIRISSIANAPCERGYAWRCRACNQSNHAKHTEKGAV